MKRIGTWRRAALPVATASGLALLLAGCAVGPDPFEWPAQPVAAPEGMVDASGPQPVSDMAWRYGEASWGRDAMGDPLIRATLTGARWADATEPVPYRIEFHGCVEGRACKELRFEAAFMPPEPEGGSGPGPAMVTAARGAAPPASPWAVDRAGIADWSRASRMGEAYLAEDGRAVLEMNLSLQGGVSRQNLDAQFQWWRALVIAFQAALAGEAGTL